MKLDDLSSKNNNIVEAQLVWARKGTKLTRKFRCAVGHRAGRVVSDPAQCSKPVDIKKRMTLMRTKAKMGGRIKAKSARTKRTNPASKMLKTLNKPKRR
tara:strand:+ start:14654 stop:14950 length:297 start_codon:yes stop_codon:yes gene_type:complete